MIKKIITTFLLMLLFVTPIYASEFNPAEHFSQYNSYERIKTSDKEVYDRLDYYVVSNSEGENNKAFFEKETQLTNFEFDSIYSVGSDVFPLIATKIIDGKKYYSFIDVDYIISDMQFEGVPFIYEKIEHSKLYGVDTFTCTLPDGSKDYYLENDILWYLSNKNIAANYIEIGTLCKFESLDDVPNPFLDREPIEGLAGYYRAFEYPARYGTAYVIVDEDYNVMAKDLTDLSDKVNKGNTIMGRNGDFAYIVNPNFDVIASGAHFNHPVMLGDDVFIRYENVGHEQVGYSDIYGNPITNENLINKLEDIGASTWAVNPINSALNREIIPLRLQGDYHKNITREEFCEIAIEAYINQGFATKNDLIEASVSPFTDVNNNYVTLASKLGVVSGVGDNKFNPNGEITRQEAAVMLAKLGELKGDVFNKRTTKFVDESYFAPWSKDAIYKVSGTREGHDGSVMAGTEKNKFSPWMTYTREQAITTIVRLFNMDY